MNVYSWLVRGLLPQIDGVYKITRYPRYFVLGLDRHKMTVVITESRANYERRRIYEVRVGSPSYYRLSAVSKVRGRVSLGNRYWFSTLGRAAKDGKVRYWRYPRVSPIEAWQYALSERAVEDWRALAGADTIGLSMSHICTRLKGMDL